jgi:phage terminase Nu1 subunit (DNA packaging protein)
MERITKKELMEMYGVDRSTIENWVKERGLPLIQVSSHKKYIRMKDLIEWEDMSVK